MSSGIVCPCGMTVDEKTFWPPYRVSVRDKDGELTYAVCIHGVVVIDKLEAQKEVGEAMVR